MLLDPENEKEVSEAKHLNDKLVNRALKMEGTSTGEHGIGIGKKEFLKTEQGLSVEIMSQIKKAIDPKNIICLLYTSPSPRDMRRSRMPSSA